MDKMDLFLSGCSLSELPPLGQYLGDCVRRRSPAPDGLGLLAGFGPTNFHIQVGDAYEGDGLTRVEWFLMVGGIVNVILGEEEADKACFDIIAHIPWEEVVDLTTTLPILHSEELCVQMGNLTRLHLKEVDLSTWFVVPAIRDPNIFKDLLRGLRSISITGPSLSDGDWSPFTNFLTRRAAVGN
jgi:hypothetical protein